MEVKDNRKRELAHIKRLSTSKTAPDNYDSNESVRVPRKERARTGVVPSRK